MSRLIQSCSSLKTNVQEAGRRESNSRRLRHIRLQHLWKLHSYLHCLAIGTRHNTGMNNLSKNGTCGVSTGILRSLAITTRAWTPCPGTAPVYLQTVFCAVWTKTPVVATRQARQPCPGTALCISRQCSALSGPKHLSLQHDGHAKIVQELHCVSPDSVLHCLDQNTCRCNTTGMPKLSRNCNCKPPKLFTPMLHQYGHVNNHAQELHLRNVRRKPGTCRCITTGRTNLSRNCNGHDNILVQKTALRTVRRKPGTCRCTTTGTSTSLPKNCNCRNSTE